MNLFQAINSALDISLATDSTYSLLLILGLRSLGKMLNLGESSDAPADYFRNMELKEFLIHL